LAYLSNPLDNTFGFLRAEDLTFNAAADMPASNSNRPYRACFENGTITIDTSKRYTHGLDTPRCGKRGVKIGSPPNAALADPGGPHFPRNWAYSCWNNATNASRDGFVVALHRLTLPGTNTIAPEYSTSNNGYSWAAIYAIIEIPNAADGTAPTTQEKSNFMGDIGMALSNDNVNFGTVTDSCGVLPPGVTTDPACTTDTYCGGWSNVDCGGYHSVTGNNPDNKNKCASYSDSTLVAGDTYKRKTIYGGGYSMQTVPAGYVICTFDAHNLPNKTAQWRQDHPAVVCNNNQDKVLGRWGSCGTNGKWECVPKLGCKDIHNTNYAPETQRTHSNAVCTAGTCISGASKMLFGSGDGSCIKSLQTWHLIKQDTGCCGGGKSKVYNDCKCRYELALGRSGWGGWVVVYNNFQGPSGGSNPTCVAGTCDQWYAGKSGLHQFTTLEAAQAVYNTMKAGAQAAVDGTGGTGNGLPTCGDNEELDTTTNTCGCKSGYVADTAGTCVAEIPDTDECTTVADCAECEICETDTDNISRCVTDPDCTPEIDDPSGCLTQHRAIPTGDSTDCGDCKSGYTENDDGDCEADADEDEEEETGLSPLVIGGMVAGAALLAMMIVKK